LEALAKSLNDPVVLRAGWAAIVGFICVLAGVWLIEPVGGAVGGGLVAIGALGLVYGGVKAAELQAGEPVAFPYMGGLKNWWDFYAAHDPVPFGPLSDREGHLYKPRQIHNRDSFLTDHNAYWENADEFVGPLARLLAEEVGFKPVAALLSDDDAVMRRAALARASRVRALRAARWVIAACTIALLAVQWGNLSDVLAWARTWLLARVGLAATSPSMPATSVWVPVLFPLVPLFAYLAVAAPLWKLWGERELAAVLRRDPAGAPVGWVALFVAAPTGVVAVSGYLLLAAHAAILAGAWIVATAAATAMLCRLHRRRLVAERE
jgi:hypothetical protein